MKKIISILLCAVILLSFFNISSFASEGINWYIKRNGEKQPKISGEHCNIEKYSGYYIDKKVNDSCNDKVLYVTFDAGYENGNIAKILDILKEKNVPSAFFILDYLIRKNPDLVKRMTDEGHMVCNHTKNHKDMTTLTDEEMKNNLLTLENNYYNLTGKKMAPYFRFPEGRYSERTIAVANNMGYKTIFWSFGYADWDNENQPNPSKALKLILDNTHNGEVILLHPTSSVNVEILPALIDKWREMGYKFGTMDMLTS